MFSEYFAQLFRKAITGCIGLFAFAKKWRVTNELSNKLTLLFLTFIAFNFFIRILNVLSKDLQSPGSESFDVPENEPSKFLLKSVLDVEIIQSR